MVRQVRLAQVSPVLPSPVHLPDELECESMLLRPQLEGGQLRPRHPLHHGWRHDASIDALPADGSLSRNGNFRHS